MRIKLQSNSILRRPLVLIRLLATVLACLAFIRLSTTANATDTNLTWTESDVNLMWAGYTNDFYTLAASGHHIFGVTAGQYHHYRILGGGRRD